MGGYSLKDYQNGFEEFKKFICTIHTDSTKIYTGYFVDKQKYANFKYCFDILLAEQQKRIIEKDERGVDMSRLTSLRMNRECRLLTKQSFK
jgi:hypothetical protein